MLCYELIARNFNSIARNSHKFYRFEHQRSADTAGIFKELQKILIRYE